ncbi:MAG TPA: glycosyltransferase family 4 protein [Thermoanaerobaculia bacterium]|nr:glycosyltransferase family 4 protein [Thermoanaerobaculia bacterium]
MKAALIASHVIQYQAPFFRLLAEEPDLDLEVLFCSTDGAKVYRDAEMQTTFRWDLDLLGGYRHRFLRNFGFGDGYTRLINPGIVPALLFGRYDAAIFFLGWGTITSLLGIAACRMRGMPVFLFGDSSFPPPERTFASKMRAGLLRTIFRLTDRFLVSGVLNADYYRYYGADESRFHLVPWAIDNTRFEEGSRFAPGEREAMRARFDIGDDDLAIVFSGKFLPRKDPMTLLRAVDAMQQRARTAVIFLGNGELREEMESFARERNLRVHFAGFVNQTDLPKHYAMADVFVLPSLDDPRATVVNEAMASGLPVAITDRCGPIGDIVRHGDNGFVFAPADVPALAGHLDALAADPELRARMARRSREIIATWDYSRGVRGVMEALRRQAAS